MNSDLRKQLISILKKLKLSQLRQLANENQISPIGSQSELIQNLLIGKQIGGARYNPEKLAQLYTRSLTDAIKERRDSFPIGSDLIAFFRSADPSPTGEFTEWIIQGYLKGGIRRLEDLLSRVKPALTNYSKLRQKKLLSRGKTGQPWTNQNDLNNFIGLSGASYKGRTFLGLEDLLEQYRSQIPELKTIKDSDAQAKADTQLIFENELVKVYQPLTEEASCRLGRNTRWCTAAKENNMFEAYSKKGPIKIIVPKQPLHIGEKYQFQHESNQYMDEQDNPVKPIELFERYKMNEELKHVVIEIYGEIDENLNKFPDNPKHIIYKEKNVSKFPDWIFNVNKTRSIDLSSNKITEFPPEIGQLNQQHGCNLKVLYLGGNKITEIPSEIGQLTNLKRLYLGGNQINKISPEIGKLTNLRSLYLDRNQIKEIPSEIGKLINLDGLDLSDNQLKKIPSDIGLLTNLRYFYIDNNKIASISSAIGKLKNLIHLSLDYNQLREPPLEIEQLDNLQTVSLKGNKIKKVPPNLKRPGLRILI